MLIGASGLAREVLAAGIAGVVGILDDDTELHGTEVGGVPVIGSIARAVARLENLLVCIGPSASRRDIVRRLGASGVSDERFARYIASSARVGATSSVGVGSIILDGVVITADASLGRHVVAMPHVTVTHDCVVDDFATLAAGASLGGGVHIREAAYMGMNVAVRQGLTIGEAATVGMGAVVLEDVPRDQTWAGVPARALGAKT
jgi:sugar O-acyltransferase (sialic acid O-acetyltransferase NeuD family)